MYTDKDRIQDAIIPALIEGVCSAVIKEKPEWESIYAGLYGNCKSFIAQCFYGLERKKQLQLDRRLARIVNKVVTYAQQNKINCRKMILITTEWARSLIEQDAIIIPPESNMWMELDALTKEITEAYDEIEGFDKIDASALKHVSKIHALTLEEGYFR